MIFNQKTSIFLYSEFNYKSGQEIQVKSPEHKKPFLLKTRFNIQKIVKIFKIHFSRFRNFTLLPPVTTSTINRNRKRQKTNRQQEVIVRASLQRDRHHQQAEAGGGREIERNDG